MASKLDQHRDDIIEAFKAGESERNVALRFNVARSTLQAWRRNNSEARQQWDAVHDLPEGATEGYEEIPVIVRDYKHMEELYVYPMGDVHLGSEAHAADRWAEWLGYLLGNEKATLLGTGDYLNAALKTSVSETYDETMRVGDAKRTLRRQLAPLAEQGRIDLLMPGNHEARIYRATGDDPIEDVTDYLEVPYAKDVAVLVYKVGKVEYTFYVRHGSGAGLVGARATKLQRQAQTLIADVYVSGHTHSQLVFPQEVFEVDTRKAKVRRRRQLFVSSGSFLNYEPYAAAIGLAPQKIGAPRIRLNGERHDVHVSI